jgi:hypothetical protein
MYLFGLIALMLAFVGGLAWASREEWRLSWLIWRNPSVMAVTDQELSRSEAYLAGEMRRLLKRGGLDEEDIWQAWCVIRDAFVEDDVVPGLEPALRPLVADPHSALRWKVNARIDGRVVTRCRELEAASATARPDPNG